ncbi:MAG: alpha-mannosidase, partial [Chitinivibrionales bacterium]|nr:alpha-mannosidase [Chitinivibrionales bacterium]MBD3395642.1 alpha-mannosidase [Chitinivibrionales bacterium]
TGASYAGLNYFEDTGDVGDYWSYYPPYGNRTFTSPGCPATIWLEENGPLSATIAARIVMDLPVAAFRADRGIVGEDRRMDETRPVTIVTLVSLKKGADRVEIDTTIENTVEDHRLRVVFPTHIDASEACAAGHFTVDRRPIHPGEAGPGEYAPEMQTLPQQTFVDVSDGKRGLAVVNNCLTEYQVKDAPDRSIALTLVRSVRNRICTEWRTPNAYPNQKGGQVLRTMRFTYAIVPHAGDWAAGDVYRHADEINVPVRAVQTGRHNQGTLPLRHSFLRVEPSNCIVSAFKRAEDRDTWVLRVFNPTRDILDGDIQFGVALEKAWRTNLNEERESEVPIDGKNRVRVTVASNRIVTLEIQV